MNDDSTIAQDLERVFRELYSHNRFANGRNDYYGVEVVPQPNDAYTFGLIIRFKSGERYCCFEPACHFGFWRRPDWERIRSIMTRRGLGNRPPLTVSELIVIVEEGACLGLRGSEDDNQIVTQSSQAYSYVCGPFREAEPKFGARL